MKKLLRRHLGPSAAVLLMAGACATLPGPSPERGSASVVGVVWLSPLFPSSDCEKMSVAAHQSAAPDKTTGRAVWHQSRGRCSYEILELPEERELRIEILAPPQWRCPDGSPVKVPVERPVMLRAHETRMIDLRVRC